MKKIIFILFAVVSWQYASAQTFTYEGLKYNVTSPTTVEVTYQIGAATGNISIPAQVTNNSITYAVTSICASAFQGCSGLTLVAIPDSVTSIGDAAFILCNGLTSVSIPNSVTSIGYQTFQGCSGLTSVTIPNSVTSIRDAAFTLCTGLTSVSIPNSVTSIGKQTFQGCSGLMSVEIPNSVTSIGDQAFLACTSLSSVIIPNSVTNLGLRAFRDCTGLRSVIISNALTSISQGTFYNCTSLASIDIPNSVTSIGTYTFRGCSGLTSVTIPNSVNSIGTYAFLNCSSLTSVAIPSSITRIEDDTFEGCSGLQSFTIPNSVISIGSSAFGFCSGLTSVTIPNSVNSIGPGAFGFCTGLTSVTIPNSITGLGYGAFYNCSSLTSVVCNLVSPPLIDPSEPYGVFGGSVNQAACTLTVPNGSIAAYQAATVWKNFSPIICSNPTINTTTISACSSYTWANNGQKYTTTGVYTGVTADCVTEKLNLTITTAPTSFNFEGLNYVVTSSTTVAVGINAGTSGSVEIPASVITECGTYAVTSIGAAAFTDCVNLTSIIIPNSVTSIGYEAFYNCPGLTSVTLPNSITSIGISAFNRTGLTSITIPNSVTSIGAYSFYYCFNLTSVTVGNSVTSIGDQAFYGCSGLSSVSIPNSVTSIGDYAFQSCGITSLTCNIETPLSINALVFYGVNQSVCTLKVPAASLDAYKAALVWKNFSPIICSNPTINTTDVSACSSYTWANNGQKYTTTGVYTGITANCVTEKLNLTITTAPTSFNFEGLNYVVTSSTTVAVGINAGTSGSVEIPASVITECGTYAVTSIGAAAFQACSDLTSVTIPNSVTSIGEYAFENCSGLATVTCDVAAPFSINANVFQGVNQTACTLKVPNGSIGAYLDFAFWSNFSPITCSNSTTNTTTISACNSYTWANNGQKYTTTGVYTGVTANCVTEKLNLTITTAPTSFASGTINYVVTSPTTVAVGVNAGTSGSILIPASVTTACGTYAVTSISASAFQACSGLTSVTIPNSVTSIGDQAFLACTSLSSVIIPNSVTNIGIRAFRDCTGLTSVTISNALTSTSQGTFYNCTSLESINIPSSVNSIGPYTFRGCSGLKFITIPNSVTSIGAYAFALCSTLTSVAIPTLVSSIGDGAFFDCYSLTSVLCDIETPLLISSTVFSGVNQGNCSLTVPNASVAAYQVATVWQYFIPISCVIRSGTFSIAGINYVVTSPTTVAVGTNTSTTGTIGIPATVTKGCNTYTVTRIVEKAFKGCSGLTSVSIPNSVTSIGYEAFAYCSGLTTVNIPNSLTIIESSTFEGCSGLTAVTIPNSVNIIGVGAFAFCTSLISVTIPNSITNIYLAAFYDCSSLRSVLCNIETPVPIAIDPSEPYAAYGIFGGSVNQAACTLAVPAASVDAYKAALVWKDFGTITSISTTYTTSWDYGVPTAIINAVIAGDYTTTIGAFTAKSLTVNPAASLTVTTGTNVTVVGALVNNGTITVQNNANLIQTADTNTNSGSGTATVIRNSNALKRLDYTIWSSPVASQNLLAFSPATASNRFYDYNSVYGTSGAYSIISSPSTTDFAIGKGYLIRMPNNANATIAKAYLGIFTGVLNNGDITVALNDGNAAGLRYNLVGNPYPSPITISTFMANNTTNIESTLYFWRKTNGVPGSAYCTLNNGIFTTNNNALSANPNGIIQTGQGFFVEAKPSATSLIFKNGQRIANTANQFFKTKQAATPSRIWLNATNLGGSFSQMAINYTQNATLGLDDFDGKYINDSPIALTTNINNEEYTIQGRPTFDPSDRVALNFKTDAADDYTIALDHSDGVFALGQDIYLVDSKTGTETNLKTDAYTFAATTGTDNTRFILKYQKTLKVDSPAFNENTVTVYKNNGILHVKSGINGISTIRIFDLDGRLIAQQNKVNANSSTIENVQANEQVLIVQVTSNDNKVVNKKVIN